jgi:tRNA threonylcarbamoyladenosine biosynthesis protein TsaB
MRDAAAFLVQRFDGEFDHVASRSACVDACTKGADCTGRRERGAGRIMVMQVLAFDTSTSWLSVALYDGVQAIVVTERCGNASSERILPAVGELLARAGTALSRLDGIAYGAGPGAFTGVRIACAVAQGLAFGADLPVHGVSTLDALAQAAWRIHRWPRVVACLDARMREVYVAASVREDNAVHAIVEPRVQKPAEVARPDDGEWWGAGDAFAVYPDLGDRLRLVACDPALFPDAQSIAECAWPRVVAGEGVRAECALPLYVRHRVALTSAERAAGLRL